MIDSGVYGIFHEPSGTVYIGQSKNIRVRFVTHKKNLLENRHINPILQRTWNKYPSEQFEFRLLALIEPPLLEAEAAYAALYEERGYTLMNIGRPGYGAPFMDEPTRHKISRTMKGRKRTPESIAKGAASQKGKGVTEEFRQKMRDTHTGRKLPREQVEKIRQSNTGKVRSLEQRQKMSESFTKSWADKRAQGVYKKSKGVERSPRVVLYCSQCGAEMRVLERLADYTKNCSRTCRNASMRGVPLPHQRK